MAPRCLTPFASPHVHPSAASERRAPHPAPLRPAVRAGRAACPWDDFHSPGPSVFHNGSSSAGRRLPEGRSAHVFAQASHLTSSFAQSRSRKHAPDKPTRPLRLPPRAQSLDGGVSSADRAHRSRHGEEGAPCCCFSGVPPSRARGACQGAAWAPRGAGRRRHAPDVEGYGHDGVEDDDVGPEGEEAGEKGTVHRLVPGQVNLEARPDLVLPDGVADGQDHPHADQEPKDLGGGEKRG